MEAGLDDGRDEVPAHMYTHSAPLQRGCLLASLVSARPSVELSRDQLICAKWRLTERLDDCLIEQATEQLQQGSQFITEATLLWDPIRILVAFFDLLSVRLHTYLPASSNMPSPFPSSQSKSSTPSSPSPFSTIEKNAGRPAVPPALVPLILPQPEEHISLPPQRNEAQKAKGDKAETRRQAHHAASQAKKTSSSSSPSRKLRSYTTAGQLVLQPRPFEELFVEQAYLEHIRYTHGYEKTRLMWEYSSIEQRLEAPETLKKRRSLRKRLSLLQCGIGKAAEQERRAMMRLSDVSMELQSRELWAQVQYPCSFPQLQWQKSQWEQDGETESHFNDFYYTSAYPTAQHEQNTYRGGSDSHAEGSVLRGSSPEFVPSDSLVYYCIDQSSSDSQTESLHSLSWATSTSLETVEEEESEEKESDKFKAKQNGIGLMYKHSSTEGEHGDETDEVLEKGAAGESVKEYVMDDMDCLLVRHRSLPNLRFLWQ